MTQEVRLWTVGDGDVLTEAPREALDLEDRLEQWIEGDVSLLSSDLMVIGRQVQTDHGGIIDLLCIDSEGDIVIVELKRARTPREVTAQVLDYAAWAQDLSSDRIVQIAARHLGGSGEFERAFLGAFGVELPETLNGTHRMLIVASNLDPATERIIEYLSDQHGVDINAVTFQFLKTPHGREVLSRVFLIEPETVEYKVRTRTSSKRRPALSYEALEEMARASGESGPYEQLTGGLSVFFKRGPPAPATRFLASSRGAVAGSSSACFRETVRVRRGSGSRSTHTGWASCSGRRKSECGPACPADPRSGPTRAPAPTTRSGAGTRAASRHHRKWTPS